MSLKIEKSIKERLVELRSPSYIRSTTKTKLTRSLWEVQLLRLVLKVNYTAEKLTDNKHFKDWFGKSQATKGSTGEPMVLYHGSRMAQEGFTVFSSPSGFPYSYFSETIEYAKDFASGNTGFMKDKIFKVYLSIKNVFDVTIFEEIQYGYKHWIESFEAANVLKKGEYTKLHEFIEENTTWGSIKFWQLLRADSTGVLKKFLKKAGFDGIKQIESNGMNTTTAWVIFEPNQVKYTEHENMGSYDEAIDDIRFDKGGLVEGDSHEDGGVDMIVNSTGEEVELEGGEAVITEPAVSSTEEYEVRGTVKEITSCLNEEYGGVSFSDSKCNLKKLN